MVKILQVAIQFIEKKKNTLFSKIIEFVDNVTRAADIFHNISITSLELMSDGQQTIR